MKKVITVLLALLLSIGFAGCGGKAMVELKYDDQINEDKSFNENLFYRNDLPTDIADPAVIYITDEESTEYGYYYMYGTTNADRGFTAYRSKTLEYWENTAAVFGHLTFQRAEDNFGDEAYWAPEVIYDEETDLYYLFYSCDSRFTTDWCVRLCLAVADEPYGPFVEYEDETHDASTPFFDNDRMREAVEAGGQGDVTNYFNCIDPHPYVAPDGQKYLYFVRDRDGSEQQTHIWAMKMNSWTEPDYSTLTRLTRTKYYTVDDTSPANRAPYENDDNSINEGPYIFHSRQADGSYRYYLTLSVNGYNDKSYTVAQAVGDDPLGPFTKLTPEEGGVLIGTDNLKWDHISGPGHHSFVEVGGEWFVVYHQHFNRVGGTKDFIAPRSAAIDRLALTKNSKGEEVLYVNGPTWSLQPRVEAYADYKNIASDATVKVSGGKNAEALTDKLLSLYDPIDYVKEYETDKEATITLTFPDYREVTGLMVYNSKNYENAFIGVKRVEFDFKDEAKSFQGAAYIDDLAFDWKFYKSANTGIMRPGGSAVAIFAPMLVKEIRVTIDPKASRDLEGWNGLLELVDEENNVVPPAFVGVSEIVVLGK